MGINKWVSWLCHQTVMSYQREHTSLFIQENSMSAQSEDVAVYMVQQQNQMMNVQTLLNLRQRRRRRRRARKPRSIWVRKWIGRRERSGIYNTLLAELENEDPKSFHEFMRMPQDMFKEIVARLTPRFLKQTTNWRAPINTGWPQGWPHPAPPSLWCPV